jgi:diketogulonate reductase-like aldo/keto reductase
MAVEAQGVRIPALGLGTYQLTGRLATERVAEALALGYRHVDTAQMYGNEAEVGAGLRAAAVPRQDVFLTTKIWPDNFRAPALLRAAEASVKALGTEPDLLLLHWPSPAVPLAETIGALNEARQRGLARQIGISNFTVELIRAAVALSAAPLIANQVEYHPWLDQGAVLAELRRQGMALIAYSPLAQGRVFGERVLARIGEAHGRTPGQVALRWLIQQPGVSAIPRSSKPSHLAANFAALDFSLSDKEMAAIDALGGARGRLVSPAGVAPEWD